MNMLRRLYSTYWLIAFFVGLVATITLALQVPFTLTTLSTGDGVFRYGFASHITHADEGGGGGDGQGGDGFGGDGFGGDGFGDGYGGDGYGDGYGGDGDLGGYGGDGDCCGDRGGATADGDGLGGGDFGGGDLGGGGGDGDCCGDRGDVDTDDGADLGGGGGDGDCCDAPSLGDDRGNNGEGGNPPQLPTSIVPYCSITASPTTVSPGGGTTVVWSTQNAISASLTYTGGSVGPVALSGSMTFFPTQNTTYVLSVVSVTGHVFTCQVSIVLTTPPVDVCPNIPGNQTTVPSGYHIVNGQCVPIQQPVPVCTISASPGSINVGQSSTITWTTQNATTATLTGLGSVALNGSTVVSPTVNTTYTLTATGPGGTVQCVTTIVVQQAPPPAIPSCTLTANVSQVQYGGSVTLTWSSNNATSATLTDVGSVAVNGSYTFHNITGSRTFVLTVSGTGGTATCQASVTTHTPPPQLPSCTIYANPTQVQRGNSAQIVWTSTNAVSAVLSSHGSVALNGSMTVSPSQTTVYTLTVYNQQGQMAQCTATITVQDAVPPCTYNCNPPCTSGCHPTPPCYTCYQPPTYQPPFHQPPIFQPPVYIPPAHSQVLGASVHYPASIPLSSIPYTGDFGPLGNALYWIGMIGFSLAGAYLLLYWRGGIRRILSELRSTFVPQTA